MGFSEEGNFGRHKQEEEEKGKENMEGKLAADFSIKASAHDSPFFSLKTKDYV